MPMQINGLAGRLGYQAIIADRARLDVADEDGKGGFYIIYRPRLVTTPAILDLSARLESRSIEMNHRQAGANLADVAKERARGLEDVVVESDLMDDEDTPLDFHYARLTHVDLFTLVALFNAIMTDSSGQMSKPEGMRSPEPLNGGLSQKGQTTNLKTSASRKR